MLGLREAEEVEKEGDLFFAKGGDILWVLTMR